MKTITILTEKNFQGALVLSAIVDNRRMHRTYMGYTKAYAKSDFRKAIKEGKI